ncbi:MAG: VacJ family lipoprotein [Paracoccaceae bacterium]|nr:VacJ family lipoprotein [Paracoccaceae bacterium]
MATRAVVSLLCVSLLAAGCAAERGPNDLIADPYAGTNRHIHDVNKEVDILLLKPASEVYDLVTPGVVKHMVSNEVRHLQLPGMFVNRILQGEAEEAAAVLTRFGVNTIVGAGGLLDPATEFGLPYEPTDFGVTLASWGVGEGIYHELPLIGPSTTRHAIGRLIDVVLDPVSLATGGIVSSGFINVPTAITTARTPVAIVNLRHENADFFDEVLYESEDSYIAVRTGYVQTRRRQVAGGETDADELPNIFD